MLSNFHRCAVTIVAAGAAIVVLTDFAAARCTRLAFSVNDYGKEGPIRDAKNLLDKHIVSWAAARGISKYTVGKKDVSCELFLDFGFFDEHTCKASATVCWPDSAGKGKATPASAASVPAEVKAPRKAQPPKSLAPKPVDAPATPAKAKPKST